MGNVLRGIASLPGRTLLRTVPVRMHDEGQLFVVRDCMKRERLHVLFWARQVA